MPDLRRFLAPRSAPAGETCEFCNAPVDPDHRHVADVTARKLMCACTPCGLLFTAGTGRYVTVIGRREALPGDLPWEMLNLPVGLAFVFLNRAQGKPLAFYPSPAGATESLVPLEAWEHLVELCPPLQSLVPDIEAVLLSRGRACIVPIDVCYELTGRIRQKWRGFDGGDEAREAIEQFLAEVAS